MSDEKELLASLNASLHEQDVYEDNVIREATQQLAPTLTGSGLPLLHSLVPSYDPRYPERYNPTDETVIFSVLNKTRHDMQEQQQNQQLQQPTNSLPNPSRLDQLLLKEQLLLSFLTNVAGKSPDELPVRPQTERLAEQQRAKAIQQTKSQSLLQQQPPLSSALRRGRAPMMQQKKVRLMVEEGTEDFLTLEQKERLRQVRLERRKRRQARWNNRQQLDNDDDSEEAEVELEDSSSSSSEENELGDNEETEQSTVALATCPICQSTISASDSMDLDAFLAQHVQTCQVGRPARPRRGRERSAVIDEPSVLPKTIKRPKRKTRHGAKKRKVHVPIVNAVDDLEEVNYEDRVDDWIENGLSRMRVMKERDVDEVAPGAQDLDGLYIPAWVNDRLFEYQREGLRWMWSLHQAQSGGVIGDEMGLGKTVQVCAFLGVLAGSRKLKSALIVAPATMLQHWLNELAIWAPGLRRILSHQSGANDGLSRSISPQMLNFLAKWLQKSRSDRLYETIDEDDPETMDPHSFCGTGYAVVTTYENLRRNPSIYEEHDWSYIVLDEAQRIRNPDADITVACKRIRTPHRLALSGTPIQNDLRELWSIFDFVFPGRLGMLQTFEQEFADPIKRGGYSNASPVQVQLAYRCSLVLKDLINPYLLRRQKKEIKEVKRMPGKTEQVLFCRLSVQQRAMYRAYLSSDEVRRVLRGNNQLFAAVTMLRKICNHPDLVCSPDQASIDSFLANGYVNEAADLDDDDDESDYLDNMTEAAESFTQRSGKLEVLSKILPLWYKQGHRVLIFCQWVKMLNIIQKFTFAQGWRFGRIDGKTSVGARQKLVDSFNADTSYFGMLCTTQTGGVGLNLTGADRVVLFDPSWNPQTDAQARERAWRFGQEREVTVYRLITAGTIEEKIYHRQIFKTSLSNKILQDPRQRRLFSQRDLSDLFTLKDDTGSVRGGSDGVTDTGALTNGAGVIDPEEEPSEDVLKDDQETIEHVMKSKGLAGIFDHNFVEQDCRNKSTSVREMEERAKQVAKQAAKALQQSVEASQSTAESRFGSGRDGSAGVLDSGKSKASSNDSNGLLASLRQRQQAVAAANEDAAPDKDTKQYAKLLSRIQEFLRGRSPSTEAIMTAFADVTSSKDVAIFRSLLKSVADVHKGKWYLKDV